MTGRANAALIREHWPLAVALASLVIWALLLDRFRPATAGDEIFHFPVVERIAAGQWPPATRLPMPPTYHAVMALMSRPFGCSLRAVRWCNLLLALVTVVLFHRIGRALWPGTGPQGAGSARVLLVTWNPLMFPLWGLVYTETGSLLCIAAATWLHLRRRYAGAALAIVVASLVRQSNVVWAALLPAWRLLELRQEAGGQAPGAATSRGRAAVELLTRATRQLWPYALALVGLGIALAMPGGLMSRARGGNRPGFNPVQLYVFGLATATLWLPLWLDMLRRAIGAGARPAAMRAATWATLVVLTGLVYDAFHNPHPWTGEMQYFHDRVLARLARGGPARCAAAGAIVLTAWAAAYLTWTHPRRAELTLVWAFALAYLLPHWLPDPRYSILPTVWIGLFAAWRPAALWRLVLWQALLTGAVAAMVLSGSTDGAL